VSIFLKQSTAVDLPIGPFLDSGDGVTVESGLTLTQPDIRLKKNGGNWAQKNAAQTLTHEEFGFYECSFDATDTDTLGVLKVAVNETGALPVWHDFMVVPANVWDSLFGADKLQVDSVEISGDATAADNLETAADGGSFNLGGGGVVAASVTAQVTANVAQISGDTTAADNAEAFFDGTGYAGTNNVIPTVTTVNGLAANTITATAIANDAITAAKIAAGAIDADAIADNAIDAGAIAADAITAAKIADGAIDAATFAADAITATVIATGAIDADAIADNAIDAGSIATGAITAAKFAASAIDAAAIAADAITAAKIADGAIDAATFAAGAINAAAIASDAITAGKIASDAIGADELAANAVTEIAAGVWDRARTSHVADGSFGQSLQLIRAGTAQAGAGTTITLDASASATDDFYNNGLVQIIGGTGVGQARYITDYVGATKVATVSIAWGTTPDNTSVFVIQPGDAVPGATAPTAADNATAVWNAARSSHTTAGSFGQGVASVQGNVTGSVGSVTGSVGSVTGAVGSVTGNVGGNVGGSVGTVATNGISAASLAADAGTEIGAAVWNTARASHVATGSFGQSIQLLRDGTAQAGSSTTITLDAGASAINDFYNDAWVSIIGGTGAGQTRSISDYVGGTKVATVSAVWGTTPDNTSVFIVEPFGSIAGATAPTADQNAAAVWNKLRTDHTTSGTFGQGAASVQGNVTGSVASVTGNVAGNVTGSVGSLATQAKADVNTEVVDVLHVDTQGELSAVPGATSTLAQKICWLFLRARNLHTRTANTATVKADNGSTNVATATLSDDGTTFSHSEWS
jgi:hypothetical protein